MEVNELKKLVDYYHENKLSHVYLLETNDIDKCMEGLKEVVKAIFCEQEYETGCKKCNICNLINQNFLPSFIVIEPTGSTIKKEQVLELKRNFSSVPIYTKENIYVIKNAEKLTGASANTMLKFIEEPEANILGFLITTNLNNVIPTIKSRCEILKVLYKEASMDATILESAENQDYVKLVKNYLYKLEVEKKDLIMYNKDVLLSNFVEREDIQKIFKIILLVYTQILNNLHGLASSLNGDWDFLNILGEEQIRKRINLTVRFLQDLDSNANIELLLDKYVIELSDTNG